MVETFRSVVLARCVGHVLLNLLGCAVYSAACCIVAAFTSQVVKSESLASLGYDATVVASGADNVRSLLDQFKAEPSTVKLHLGFTTNQAAAAGGVDGSSAGTTAAVDSTMLTRTSITHFADLVRDQGIPQLVRVAPKFARSDVGHFVALGSDGFFLCTCLELLNKGLPCRHGILALLETQVVFNGACVALRWRTNAAPWIMEPLASKLARLASASAGSLAGRQPVAPVPNVVTPSNEHVRSTNYANCCAFGKELAGMLAGVNSIEGVNRILHHLKKVAVDSADVEEVSQRRVSRTTVFKGVDSRYDVQGNGDLRGGRSREVMTNERRDRGRKRRAPGGTGGGRGATREGGG